MVIEIQGSHPVSDRLAALVSQTEPFRLASAGRFPAFTVSIETTTSDRVGVDTPDGPFERHLFSALREIAARYGVAKGIGRVALDAEGGNQDPNRMVVRVPVRFTEPQHDALVRAIWIALLKVTRHGILDPPLDAVHATAEQAPIARSWWARIKDAVTMAVVVMTCSASASGQTIPDADKRAAEPLLAEARILEKDRQLAVVHFELTKQLLEARLKANELDARKAEAELTARATPIIEQLRVLYRARPDDVFDFTALRFVSKALPIREVR